jgi:hypothetical protein
VDALIEPTQLLSDGFSVGQLPGDDVVYGRRELFNAVFFGRPQVPRIGPEAARLAEASAFAPKCLSRPRPITPSLRGAPWCSLYRDIYPRLKARPGAVPDV